MKKIFYVLIMLLALSCLSTDGYAGSLKTITLSDGSQIKGRVIDFANGTYSIETSHMGTIEISDEDIVNIGISPAPALNTSLQKDSSPQHMQEKIMKLQQGVLADQSIMADITDLSKDEEIINLLNDQDLLNDLMSYDIEKLKTNPKIQQLIQNPKIQNIINKAAQKNLSISE